MSHTRGIGRKRSPQFERCSRVGTPLKSLQAHRSYWPAEQNVSIHRQLFGKTLDGHAVELYTLTNQNGRLSGSDTVLNHTVRLMAERFLPVDQTLIPIGEQRSVEGTPFDFMQPAAIGSRLHMDEAQLRLAGGYDHNWILSGVEEPCPLAAEVYEPVTGRVLRIYTTQPGIQFYTGNMLDGSIQGKLRRVYVKHSGLCLEPQHFPDSPNQLSFPSTMLRTDETYRQTTIYRFAINA